MGKFLPSNRQPYTLIVLLCLFSWFFVNTLRISVVVKFFFQHRKFPVLRDAFFLPRVYLFPRDWDELILAIAHIVIPLGLIFCAVYSYRRKEKKMARLFLLLLIYEIAIQFTEMYSYLTAA